MEKPNIVVIFTDQQRHDTLGVYGQTPSTSPNIDKLAEESVVFDYAFTPQPVCGPARSCLQTGLYATKTGCYRNGIALPEHIPTIAKSLKNEGYKTGYVGKWHLASTVLPSFEDIGERKNYHQAAVPKSLRGGYEFWRAADALEHTSSATEGHVWDENGKQIEFSKYRVDAITDYALEFLNRRENDSSNSFFLFISYLEPHHQNNERRFVGPLGSKEKYKNIPIPKDLTSLRGDWKENYADYIGACASIDANVGRIIQKLKTMGTYENTSIIFTSDHGCHFRTRNREYKRSCHDASIHIPLIIKSENYRTEHRSEMVNLVDIPPTILDLAGAPNLESMQGRSLHTLSQHPVGEEKWRDEVFFQISESQLGRGIRTKKWKFSVKSPWKDGVLHSKATTYMADCLYNLENDPYELTNLVKDTTTTPIQKQLAKKIHDYIKEIEGLGINIFQKTSKIHLMFGKLRNRWNLLN
ncbi:MAG: sulfatase-like hydrolase/transferase [Promethearchaeota archaeon]